VLRPLSAAALLAAWLWFCREQGLASGYGGLKAVSAIGLVLYAVAAWQFGLDPPEKEAARRWLAKAQGRGMWRGVTGIESGGE
jgi:hypothetical protein